MRRFLAIAWALLLVSCAKGSLAPYSLSVLDIGACRARVAANVKSPDNLDLPFFLVRLADNPELKGARVLTTNQLENGQLSVWAYALVPETVYYYETRMIIDGVNYDSELMVFQTGALPDGAVDMGGSVLWASANLGASAPESYGTTVPWTGEDAAAAALEGGWRMPTSEEMQELVRYNDYYYISYKGVPGLSFTNRRNGNSLFFPSDVSADYGLYWAMGPKKEMGWILPFQPFHSPVQILRSELLVDQSKVQAGVIRPILPK